MFGREADGGSEAFAMTTGLCAMGAWPSSMVGCIGGATGGCGIM